MKMYELISKISVNKNYKFANLIMKLSVKDGSEYVISRCIKEWIR